LSARAVIIDCDPGQDDAVALLLAFASPAEIEVLGITVVAGNVPLELTERNARRIRDLAGKGGLGVYAGCARPLKRALVTAEHVHGKTGIDGARLPEPEGGPAPLHGIDFLIESLRSPEVPVTICALGPLTNIATALTRAPEIRRGIAEIVLMGGAIGLGNVTPAAEFNIHVDPDAAQVVFTSGVKITMIGLDVTHKAIVTPDRLGAIEAIGTPVSKAVSGMLAFSAGRHRGRIGGMGSPLHDPCVIAYLLDPPLFAGREAHVAIETESTLTLGRTVVDWWGVTGSAPNAKVIDGIDADGFFALLTERLARLVP
jgi:purine nucleosidase